MEEYVKSVWGEEKEEYEAKARAEARQKVFAEHGASYYIDRPHKDQDCEAGTIPAEICQHEGWCTLGGRCGAVSSGAYFHATLNGVEYDDPKKYLKAEREAQKKAYEEEGER